HERQRPVKSSHPRKAAGARRRELRAEELRDAGEPAERCAHSAGRFAERDAVRFRADNQDYISRLHQIPRVLEQTTEVMRQGEKDKLMPPKLVLEKLP